MTPVRSDHIFLHCRLDLSPELLLLLRSHVFPTKQFPLCIPKWWSIYISIISISLIFSRFLVSCFKVLFGHYCVFIIGCICVFFATELSNSLEFEILCCTSFSWCPGTVCSGRFWWPPSPQMWSPRDNNEAGMATSRVAGGGPVHQRIYAENAQNKLMYIYNTSGL